MRVKTFLLGCLLCQSTLALQQAQVQPDVMSTLTVSNSQLNILRLKHDRIESFAVPESVEVQHDAKTGEVIFKIHQAEPVEGFVIAESGHRYPLRFVPSDIAAETLVLTGSERQPSRAPMAQPYTTLLADLLKAMYNQQDLEGYQVEVVNQKQNFKGGKLIHKDRYLGAGVVGDVLEFKNPGAPMSLREMDFYQRGVRAIAITTKQLPVKGFTRVFVIRDSHDE